MSRATLTALLAGLCLLLLAGSVLLDARCFVALVAAVGLFAIAERGLPLPVDIGDKGKAS